MSMRTRRDRGGAALALVLLMVFFIAGLAAAMVQVSVSQNKVSYEAHSYMELSYAADGALRRLRRDIETSAYDSVGNVWLSSLSVDGRLAPLVPLGAEVMPDDAHARVYPDFVIGRCDVSSWVYPRDAGSKFYTLVVKVETPSGPLVPLREKKRMIVAQEVQAHDSFNRFATFVNSGDLRFGETVVNGHVHTNGRIHFYDKDAEFHSEVTSRQRAVYHEDASRSAIDFRQGLNDRASHIPMPDKNDLDILAGAAGNGEYFVDPASEAYKGLGATALDAAIEFHKDGVRITAINAITNQVVKSQDLPYPPNGVIFAHGNIRSIKGQNGGRVSVAAAGMITVTDNIISVDADGDPAYVLKKDGTTVDAKAETEAWTAENKFAYESNKPSFDPPQGQEPVLGLLANGQILLGGDQPNLEVHAALFSLTSNWQSDVDGADPLKRGNLRIVGSLVSNDPGVRAYGDAGFVLSGGYLYDEGLLNNPPPSWLRVETSFFKGRRRLR